MNIVQNPEQKKALNLWSTVYGENLRLQGSVFRASFVALSSPNQSQEDAPGDDVSTTTSW